MDQTRSSGEVFAKGGRAGAQPALSGTEIKPIMPPKCPHGRRRYVCKDCGGGGLCEHGRERSQCKECGGGGICEHGRERSRCKDCGGSSICEHGRTRSRCKECGGSSQDDSQDAIVLEVTAVEVDEDAEPDEWIPTVQSHIVVAAGPRDGKRKR